SRFICQQVEVPTDEGDVWISRVSWGTQHIHETADEAIAAQDGAEKDPTSADDCVSFLETVLADGPVNVRDAEKEARAAGGIGSEQDIRQSKAMRTARSMLG